MANGQPVPLEISMRERMTGAPRQPDLLELPPDDGSDRLRAGVVRRRRQGAHAGVREGARSERAAADGAKFEGPSGLRQALARYSPQFVNNLTEKLFVYALGRSVDYRDMPQIRAIVRNASGTNYRLSSLILGIVKSPAFTMNPQRRRF